MRRISLPLALLVLPVVAGLALSACPPPGGDDDDDDDDDDGPGDVISEAALRDFTTILADDALEGRDEGTPGGDEARRILIEKLTECGVEGAGASGFEQPITGGDGTNVIGRVTGTADAGRVTIISAHFDHVGACGGDICNGALDNAAGVSAVVGVACEIAASPLPTTLIVALWDAEEPPTFLSDQMGSEFFAASGLVDLESVDAVLVLDLVGGELWPGYGKHFLMGAEKAPALSAVLDGVTPPAGLDVIRGGLHLIEETPFGRQPWSDYDAFRNRGVPFVFFSDGQNKRYHEVNDEADALQYDKLAKETEHLLAVVEAIAESPGNFAFDAGAEELERDRDAVNEILTDALAPGGLVESLGLSATSRSNLEAALEAAQGSTNAATLEAGAIRVMCYAGSSFSESNCNLF
jgi:hypothetical protein